MKNLSAILFAILVFTGCEKSEVVSEFTGNESKYALSPGSNYAINGTVTLKERKDGSTNVIIELKGTKGDANFPVHLHLGDLSTPKASIAALLTPVSGITGKSETVLTNLADESALSYQKLVSLAACIKIHLSDVGAERDIVLAGGNVGKATTLGNSNGRIGFSECKSEF